MAPRVHWTRRPRALGESLTKTAPSKTEGCGTRLISNFDSFLFNTPKEEGFFAAKRRVPKAGTQNKSGRFSAQNNAGLLLAARNARVR